MRPALRSDAADVWALLEGLVLGGPPERALFDRTFPTLTADDAVALLVHEGGGGEVDGYVHALTRPSLYANGPVCWVSELMVAPGARRRGTGAALIRAVEEWANLRGCREVTLATSRAREFYEAIGYDATAQYLKKRMPQVPGT
ncbi:hypothetical protein Dac01nite_13260 [Demequina activiva]|uniref:N-acetyltransferase domain-containing protein n=1 Tax=Demequina activiva TaxID=1582364 RepID=A0A919Q202_9MICO|nr:hypothetical protein Dac01nite_13260 [Demequina activiva]